MGMVEEERRGQKRGLRYEHIDMSGHGPERGLRGRRRLKQGFVLRRGSLCGGLIDLSILKYVRRHAVTLKSAEWHMLSNNSIETKDHRELWSIMKPHTLVW